MPSGQPALPDSFDYIQNRFTIGWATAQLSDALVTSSTEDACHPF